MTLFEKINNDIMQAMKDKNSELLSVLRMVKGAMQLEKINKKRDLEDNEVIAIISKQIKLRKESIVEFEKANRSDLIAQNEAEISILSKYLPEQLSTEKVDEIITEAFEKINPTSMKDMGIIMKEVTPLLAGKTDMKNVSLIIKSKLENI